MALHRHLLIAGAVALSLAFLPLAAGERYHRDWSDHPGMPRQVWDVAQDDRGFLWLGSEEGIYRFDGQEVVAWGRVPEGSVVGVNSGPDGRIVGFTEQGTAYEVVADGLRPLLEADGAEFGAVHDADYDARGGLWIACRSGLFHRDPDGRWQRVAPPELEGQEPSRVRGAGDGGSYVGTSAGRFLRVHADGTAETWWSDPTGKVTRIAVKDEHTQAFGLRFGPNNGVYRVDDGQVRAIYRVPEIGRRWTGLVFRDDTLWISSTGAVIAVTDDGRRVEELGIEDGMLLGGEASVDHENSLWLSAFRGLYQYPEPDVVAWSEMDGTREVHPMGSQIVAGRWKGPHLKEPDGTWRKLSREDREIFDPGGVSPWGTLWAVAVEQSYTPRRRSALVELVNGRWRRHVVREWGAFDGGYAGDGDGVFWILFHNDLWRVDREGESPRTVARLPVDKGVPVGLDVEGRRVRAAFRYGPYCEATLSADRESIDGEWRCETVEGAGELLDFERIDGEIYLATWSRGVVRRDDRSWTTVVGERELDTSTVRGISPSPRGGMWVVSYLGRVRVELGPEGARVVERIGPWIGAPRWLSFKALELEDGTVWLSGMAAAIEIPARARQRPMSPPSIFVTAFQADGRTLSPDVDQTLAAGTRRIELDWAAPTYRDPSALRYEVRADPDDPWTVTRDRSFRFVDLGPGDYRIEVRASLDGETWSPAPAVVRFAILDPLWRRPSSWIALLSLAAIGVLAAQWIRARQQVRLERQRTEIAMNLHDELGAGLASIGLLSDIASADFTEPVERRKVATRVGEISRDLSRSLSDIVWTLRPRAAELSGFAPFLRQRAADLLGDARVKFDFPDPVPAVLLQLEVRSQIQAIASEALHNAAKHARATSVRIVLEQDEPSWVLRIEDDGAGFDDAKLRAGLGLESMRRRAEKIGARLSIDTMEGGGCRVELRFRPRVGKR